MLVGYYIIKYFYEVIVNKKAFSLFELILVIILIGIVYSLVLGKLDKKQNLTINKIENLKDILSSNSQSIELIVFDKCSRVIINNKEKDFDKTLFKDIEVYTVENDTLKRVEFAPISINDKIYDVCLKFKIFKNGSSSSFIIKKDEKYIVFFPYFKNSEVFTNESDAIEAYQHIKLLEEYNSEE
jgi:type II secretory pathway pseudopilin PulG